VLKLVLRKKRKWLTFILAMTLLWGYGAITGFSASVVRACCMFSFFVLSDCFLLSRNTGNTIAGSTLLILYFQPYLIFNLGFLLSLSAVLGIVVIHPLIMRFGYTENKIGYYLLSSTSITLSAQITTLPLTLYIFHSFPTYFIFANLILVPWSSLILYIGITFMLLSGIPFMGPLIAEILSVTTSAMNKFIHLIQYLPRAQLTGINFNQEQLLFSYLLLLALILFLFFKWKHTLHFTGITVLLFICFSYKPSTKTGVLFTYYQSNFLLLGTEKELFLACNNDTLSKRYLCKLNSWKYQRNRASQEIKTIPFPSRLTISENGTLISIGTINSNKTADFLLLNEELKNQKVDSAFIKEILHEKILLGKGVPRRKAEAISSFLEEKNIAIQNIQSQPFIIK
jgi:competence protein ComEC